MSWEYPNAPIEKIIIVKRNNKVPSDNIYKEDIIYEGRDTEFIHKGSNFNRSHFEKYDIYIYYDKDHIIMGDHRW